MSSTPEQHRDREAREAARRGAPSQVEVARARDRAVVEWAAAVGFVPSLSGVRKIILNRGLGRVSIMSATRIRRRAFGLRPLDRHPATGGYPVIPFPVPAEYLADD